MVIDFFTKNGILGIFGNTTGKIEISLEEIRELSKTTEGLYVLERVGDTIMTINSNLESPTIE